MNRYFLNFMAALSVGLIAPTTAANWPADWGYRMSFTAVTELIEGADELDGFPLLVILDAERHADALGSDAQVWTDFQAAYHFEEDPSLAVLRDASPTAAYGAIDVRSPGSWESSDLQAAMIGNGWYYSLNKTVHSDGISITTPSWSVSAWLKHEDRGPVTVANERTSWGALRVF